MRSSGYVQRMNSILYLIRGLPGSLADETIDMVLVSGVFGQPTTVLFMDDGVNQLFERNGKHPSNDTTRKWSALPTYEIERVVVHDRSIKERRLDASRLPDFTNLVTDAQVERLLHEAVNVVSD
ncbi:MAG: hypothetical protein F4X44_13635 [Gammaproteobacteria bacterium]|nr:hypothetical protein [Gammaproteobacteria bacterium]MYD81639.1 hypothetical protein [Gammaproteobacteria bacterium]